ncbi:MAG: DUF4412 domain-containing protein [Acidobacteriota bacterium]|nr:MAG: DUF4412 domain-containing protein [Acidobacteriota bacterium]
MRMPRLVASLVGLLLALGTGFADTYVVEQLHTDPVQMMGKTRGGKDVRNTLWIGSDRIRRDEGGDSSVIVRLDQSKMYIVNHKEKSYVATDLPLDVGKLFSPEMAPMMKAMLEGMKFEAKVTPTEEKKKIGEWNCSRYDVEVKGGMMNMTSTVWATKDVPIDLDAIKAMYEALSGMQPQMAPLIKEMARIDGYRVLQESEISPMGMKMKTTETLVSVENKPAPAGTYDPPEGYSLSPFLVPTK